MSTPTSPALRRERFWAKVDKSAGPDGCWLWTACIDHTGYGCFTVFKRHVAAHRFSYEETVGPITDGLVIDHLCRTRACVNPRHLEPVTFRENCMRGVAPNVIAARTMICRQGHDMSAPRGFIVKRRTNGTVSRRCRVCANAWNLRRYHAERAA